MTTALSKEEKSRLTTLEGVIRRGMGEFVRVGLALMEIRENRLYRASHKRFEDYCHERWQFNRQRASQLIQAARATQELSTKVDVHPTSETHVRPLLALPPEDRPAAWTAAVEATGGHPSRRAVEEEVEHILSRARAGLGSEGLARLVAMEEEALKKEAQADVQRQAEESVRERIVRGIDDLERVKRLFQKVEGGSRVVTYIDMALSLARGL